MQNAIALAAEAPNAPIVSDHSRPANCFVVNGSASPGIKLSIDNPAVPHGTPALMLSERRYVGRHRDPHRGCLLDVAGKVGIMRRAKLDELLLPNGQRIPIFSRLDLEKSSYVLAHVLCGLASGVKLRPGVQALYSGVRGGTLVSSGPTEMLVQVKEGDLLQIFYLDGRVSMINYAGILAGEKVTFLSVENSLAERLDLAEEMLQNADELADHRKLEVQNQTYRELAALLTMSKIFDSAVRNKIVVRMEKLASRWPLSADAHERVRSALAAVGMVGYYSWLVGDDVIAKEVGSGLALRKLRRCIAEQHQLIEGAIANPRLWDSVAASLTASAARGELGFSAQKRFCTNCPPRTGLSEAVGKLPVAFVEGEKKASPLVNKTKAVDKTALRDRRAERNKNRPVGMTGTKPNPGLEARNRREAALKLKALKKK